MKDQWFDTEKTTLKQLRHAFDSRGLEVQFVFSDAELCRRPNGWCLDIFHSTWSGYSIMNIAAMAMLLSQRPIPSLSIRVIDIDSVAENLVRESLGKHCQGYGESAMFRDGLVVQVLGPRRDPPRAVDDLRAALAGMDGGNGS